MAKERFAIKKSSSSSGTSKIIVDTNTGVNYLFHRDNSTGSTGMVMLVNAEGKPIVTLLDD